MSEDNKEIKLDFINMDIQSVKNKFSIVGNSEEIDRVISKLLLVAPTDISVLIVGESGVGKENIPKIIHSFSKRKHKNFISINCGAIPEGTIDSELFGHEKGAFTGAINSRKGYFESANGGTIFLDEVGELPLTTQVKLLRILETGEFIKVGSSEVLKTDVRIVGATNVDILKSIKEGKFREDLYYRLNTVEIDIPPLRERKKDIYILFRKFAMEYGEKYKISSVRLDKEAISILENYRWYGNIRQLKNITEQISIFENDKIITKEVLSSYLPNNNYLPSVINEESITDKENLQRSIVSLREEVDNLKKILWEVVALNKKTENSIEEVNNSNKVIDISNKNLNIDEREKELIKKMLENSSNKKDASEKLGISESTLYRKIKEYGL